MVKSVANPGPVHSIFQGRPVPENKKQPKFANPSLETGFFMNKRGVKVRNCDPSSKRPNSD